MEKIHFLTNRILLVRLECVHSFSNPFKTQTHTSMCVYVCMSFNQRCGSNSVENICIRAKCVIWFDIYDRINLLKRFIYGYFVSYGWIHINIINDSSYKQQSYICLCLFAHSNVSVHLSKHFVLVYFTIILMFLPNYPTNSKRGQCFNPNIIIFGHFQFEPKPFIALSFARCVW